MAEYLEFARSHPLLVFGFLGVLGFTLWSEYNRMHRKYKPLGVNDAVRLLNNDDVHCIDVREEKEVDNAGIIKGAKHIPISEFSTRIVELEKNKQQPFLIYCHSGSRSGHACNLLTKQGFEDVSCLNGGVLAWESANLPLEKK